jgi:hypothetical protein
MVADSVRRMSSWFLSGEEEGEQKGMESIAEGDDSKAGDEQQELEGKECDSVERVDGADSSGTGVANANETALHENEEAEPTAAEPTAAEPSAVTELKDDVLASTEVASKAIASPEKGVQGGGEETGLGDEFVTGGEERVEERLAIVGPTVDADTVGVGVDTVVELVVAADMTGQAKTSTPEAATTGPVAKATYEGVVAEEMQEEVEEEEVEEKAAETLDNADKIRGKMEEDNNGKQEVAEAPEEREENEEAEQGQKEAQQKEGQKETELKQMPKEKEEEEES